jgi:predicted nucleic acid-binding protein
VKVYVDTSALAKWYIDEVDSDAFEAFIQHNPGAAISRLTVVEMRCLLARRRRNREITAKVEQSALKLFESDVRAGFLEVLAMTDTHFAEASDILDHVPHVPLRTLDALHLAVAAASGARLIATADRVMGEAARALRFETQLFN